MGNKNDIVQNQVVILNHFYKEILELEEVRAWDTGCMFNTGAGLMEIFNDGECPLGQGTIRHFALATDDVDACAKKVKEAGYEGEYIGVGSCILGYPADGFPGPIERKPDYFKIIK